MSTEDKLKCAECRLLIPIAAVTCDGCGAFVGYPNVRYARRTVEVKRLAERVAATRAAAAERGAAARLEDFSAAVGTAQAVIARSMAELDAWLNSSNSLLVSYYKLTRSAGCRIPEDNVWDPSRDRNDSSINPIYYEDIQCAALSLDGRGVGWFGSFHIQLKEEAIRIRASVFEENPVQFLHRHPLKPTENLPPGFRADWSGRALLAVAKLGGKIESTTRLSQFGEILLERGNSPDGDFIEVHIYGKLHASAIAAVRGTLPSDPVDRAIWSRVRRKLDADGVGVDEYVG